ISYSSLPTRPIDLSGIWAVLSSFDILITSPGLARSRPRRRGASQNLSRGPGAHRQAEQAAPELRGATPERPPPRRVDGPQGGGPTGHAQHRGRGGGDGAGGSPAPREEAGLRGQARRRRVEVDGRRVAAFLVGDRGYRAGPAEGVEYVVADGRTGEDAASGERTGHGRDVSPVAGLGRDLPHAPHVPAGGVTVVSGHLSELRRAPRLRRLAGALGRLPDRPPSLERSLMRLPHRLLVEVVARRLGEHEDVLVRHRGPILDARRH